MIPATGWRPAVVAAAPGLVLVAARHPASDGAAWRNPETTR